MRGVAEALRRIAQEIDENSPRCERHPDELRLLAGQLARGLAKAKPRGKPCSGYRRKLDVLSRCKACGREFTFYKRAPWHARAR